MKRRHLLKYAALTGATGFLSTGINSWVWKNPAQAANTATNNPPRLVVVLLRGAADGLNIVVPYKEANYYEARPGIAIAPPGETRPNGDPGAIDLNGQFGLHPALAPMLPQWQAQNLAFFPACGSPVVERSHFQAQDNLESGVPGEGSADGWLNRLLAFLPDHTPTQAVSLGRNSSFILQGSQPVANLAIDGAGMRPLPVDHPQIQANFDQLYAQHARLGPLYQEGRIARDVLLGEINGNDMEASRGAPTPDRFASNARHLARLIAGDSATQIAFMELGRWDTHVNQRGILNRNLAGLGNGLAALAEELGPVYDNTAIVVVSEFGRTLAENGNGGTDHGYGNALWLLGGAIKGGKMYGDWPGLAPNQLHQSRDLEITTDFRDVLSSLLSQHFSLTPEALSQVFPDYQPQQTFQLVA